MPGGWAVCLSLCICPASACPTGAQQFGMQGCYAGAPPPAEPRRHAAVPSSFPQRPLACSDCARASGGGWPSAATLNTPSSRSSPSATTMQFCVNTPSVCSASERSTGRRADRSSIAYRPSSGCGGAVRQEACGGC